MVELFVMTSGAAFPVLRVGRTEGWWQWGQSITALIRGGGRRVLYQRWWEQNVRSTVVKQQAQTAKFVGTMTISIESVGSAGAASLRKSTCIWGNHDGGAVVCRGGVCHESL